MSDTEKLEAWRAALAAHVDRLTQKPVSDRQAAPEAPPAERTDAPLDVKQEQQQPRTPPEWVELPEENRRL